MDDGSRQGTGLHISVYGFSNTDVDKLMFTLQDKFNLKCSIHYNRDKKPRIYIFKELLTPLIPEGIRFSFFLPLWPLGSYNLEEAIILLCSSTKYEVLASSKNISWTEKDITK